MSQPCERLGPGREHCPTQTGSTPRAPVVGGTVSDPWGRPLCLPPGPFHSVKGLY